MFIYQEQFYLYQISVCMYVCDTKYAHNHGNFKKCLFSKIICFLSGYVSKDAKMANFKCYAPSFILSIFKFQ